MRYEPKLPEHNDNVSHEKPAREFLTILVGFLVVAAILFWVLGLLVDVAVDHMSPSTEARINEAVAFKWEQEKPYAPEKQAMLQKMVEELRQCAGVPFKVTVHLAKSEQPNAAVFPGGHIVVFSGLLDKVGSENGLAFVMAHEFSHLKNRDHLRAMGRGLLIAGVMALLTGADSDITQILMPVDRLGNARHSQKREMEADTTALQVLNCRYGHVGGATEFFEAMKNDERADDKGFSHYFGSHPQVQARIDNINRLIEQAGMKRDAVALLEKNSN
ncbi:M48 family metallopeptidase [Oxalobacteraceae bacterium R-40]|uniref:M48 family metallopeptidase n=1 Tax=Keguizhuia sedimenti TaxID=3064264 RepID=A0ABU1BRS1_9BURK|nr:M48 family metallopeptidase [Oxalobacteraceae bacterium R-40]